MARILIEVGPLSIERQASDAKAQEVLGQFADEIGATGTAQEKGNAIIDHLISYMKDMAKAQRRKKAETDGIIAAQEAIDDIDWNA